MLTGEVHRERVEPLLVPLDEVTMHLPFEVADYVDFYCSLQHATNVGRIFRPDGEALPPNWRHLPVGYHGRAGTVVVSGTDVRRPARPAVTGSTDGEGRPSHLRAEPSPRHRGRARLRRRRARRRSGQPVPTAAFAEHVFGVTPLNDWSARDIQAWEYVPLGPFLGKSFATSISAWITPLQALDAARVPLPGQDPEPLEYLRVEEPAGYDIAFEVELNGEVVSRPPYAAMYWSPAQMLAHMTVNGASLRTGDLFASGTISGDERDQRGSFLELSWGGKEPFGGRPHLPRGRRRGHAAGVGPRRARRPDRAGRGDRDDPPGGSAGPVDGAGQRGTDVPPETHVERAPVPGRREHGPLQPRLERVPFELRHHHGAEAEASMPVLGDDLVGHGVRRAEPHPATGHHVALRGEHARHHAPSVPGPPRPRSRAVPVGRVDVPDRGS